MNILVGYGMTFPKMSGKSSHMLIEVLRNSEFSWVVNGKLAWLAVLGLYNCPPEHP